MFLVHLWNYIRGYVMIVVAGRSVERFINICTKRQILLWDILRTDENTVTIKLSVRGFMLIRPAAKKSGCRVHIVKKVGLPFIFGRLKRRKGFQAGLFLFAAILLFSTSIVWEVTIEGGKPEMIPQVMDIMKSEKIGWGRFKLTVDPRELASKIVLEVDNVAWAGVEMTGVRLIVRLEESIPKPEIEAEDVLGDVVAQRDGIITSMEVLAGTAMVSKGDTVKKGQVLITGKLTSKTPEFGTKDVKAQGVVTARTWYECSLPVSYDYTQRLRTGKVHERLWIKLADITIPLPGGKPKFESYDSDTYEKRLAGPFGLNWPLGLTVEKSFEIMERKVQLTPEEARGITEENARLILAQKIPEDGEVTDERIRYATSESGQEYVQVVLECEEDIAEETVPYDIQ